MSDNLKNALGLSVSIIASEHYISAGMSSPWSVAKFAETPEDAAQIWKLFREAAIASLVTSSIVGWLLGDWEAFLWSLAGSIGVMLFVGSEYDRALKGTL